jgi:hypothetical protein
MAGVLATHFRFQDIERQLAVWQLFVKSADIELRAERFRLSLGSPRLSVDRFCNSGREGGVDKRFIVANSRY